MASSCSVCKLIVLIFENKLGLQTEGQQWNFLVPNHGENQGVNEQQGSHGQNGGLGNQGGHSPHGSGGNNGGIGGHGQYDGHGNSGISGIEA